MTFDLAPSRIPFHDSLSYHYTFRDNSFLSQRLPTASFARRSASSLPSTPECPFTFTK